MTIPTKTEAHIARRYQGLAPFLNERQRRLLAGAEASTLGRGAIAAVSRATGLSVNTVKAGREEFNLACQGKLELETTAVRRPGAGRRRIEQKMPGVTQALARLVEPMTRGEPTSSLRWTTKSTTRLAQELSEQGFSIGRETVGNLLKEQNFSLQSVRKRYEGKQHPDRDAQFHYIHDAVEKALAAGQPVISVDTKAKEKVGNFMGKGQEYQPKGEPVEVNVYDFPSLAKGKAIPYGVYDVGANEGWVSVGISRDTAQMAVNTIAQWWRLMGKPRYGGAQDLLLTADCGGGNGYRTRLWKRELQRFAQETGLSVTVLHLPPGTSKWNKIEHRMFGQITLNWRSRPLISYEVIVNCIANTTTETGLRIGAELDDTIYEKGIKVSDEEMAAINITCHDFHGEWNYTIAPGKDT